MNELRIPVAAWLTRARITDDPEGDLIVGMRRDSLCWSAHARPVQQ
jgi:hypothetical protein